MTDIPRDINWKTVDLTSPAGEQLRKELEAKEATQPKVPPKKLPAVYWSRISQPGKKRKHTKE